MAESVILDVINNIVNIAQSVSPANVDGILFILTFFMIFAISFVSLAMVPALADNEKSNKKAIRAIIALAIAYFSATNPLVTTSIERVFPSIGVIIIGAAAFMLTIYFIFPEQSTANSIMKWLFGPIVLGVILLLIWGMITQWESTLFERTADGIKIAGVLITNYDIALGILIIIFILFMVWAMGGGETIGKGIKVLIPDQK